MQVSLSKGPCYLVQLDDDKGTNRAKFVDLKRYPNLTDELPEVIEWPTLGDLLRGINGDCEAIRTIGCGLNLPTPDYRDRHDFVEITLYHPLTEHSPRARKRLCDVLLAQLEQSPHVANTAVELTRSTAYLPGDEVLVSLRLWLRAAPLPAYPFVITPEVEPRTEERARIATTFPFIIAALKDQRIEDYLRIAEEEMAGWRRPAENQP
jgi:hypothetical protein